MPIDKDRICMAGERILVVDDAPDVLEALVIALNDSGFETQGASDGRAALRAFYEFQPQLVLLDLIMPTMSGLEVCRQVRAMSDVPVVFLSGIEDIDRKVEAFRAGGDDFIVKGGSFSELLARVEANLRRAVSSTPTQIIDRFQDGFLDINFVTSEVTANGIPVDLTPIEYRLLTELVNHIGSPVPPTDLLERVWGPDYETENLVKWHMSRLRKKLGDNDPMSKLIVTRRGFGYVYNSPAQSLGMNAA
ncbi:MAG: response regulator transcription factor [Chloroflexi bacterium]|nr:response regulator transcription factor [Chloroflexota bacterium]